MVFTNSSNNLSLAEAYKRERDANVRERILVVSLLKQGKSSYEIGELLECPHSKVLYWKYRYENEGMEGLKTRKRPGRPSMVRRARLDEIREAVEDRDWWTAKTVRELICKDGGYLYSERQVQRLLHKWGLSRIRPRKRHVKAATDEEVAAFKKRPGGR